MISDGEVSKSPKSIRSFFSGHDLSSQLRLIFVRAPAKWAPHRQTPLEVFWYGGYEFEALFQLIFFLQYFLYLIYTTTILKTIYILHLQITTLIIQPL